MEPRKHIHFSHQCFFFFLFARYFNFQKTMIELSRLWKKAFENIVGKRENAGYQCWSSKYGWVLPLCLFTMRLEAAPYQLIFCIQTKLKQQIKSSSNHSFNPLPNKPWFLRVCRISFLKILWEKEKSLIISNFSFSHFVLYLFRGLSAISLKLKLLSAGSFSLEESKI